MHQLAMIFMIFMFTIQILLPGETALSCQDNRLVQKHLHRAAVDFFNSLKPGICAQILLNSTVRSQYLSDNLIGRILPVGTFLIPIVALEYWYGFGCNIPGLPPRTVQLQKVEILHLAYDPSYYRVSFQIQVDFLPSPTKLILFGILAFNDRLQLCGYNGVIENVGLTFNVPSTADPDFIANLCGAIQYFCPVNTTFEQYSNLSDCISFLTQTPFGSFDQADQNNVACRSIHIQLAEISPQIHCPHVGKTGGGFCTNKTAESYFKGQTQFLSCAHKYG